MASQHQVWVALCWDEDGLSGVYRKADRWPLAGPLSPNKSGVEALLNRKGIPFEDLRVFNRADVFVQDGDWPSTFDLMSATWCEANGWVPRANGRGGYESPYNAETDEYEGSLAFVVVDGNEAWLVNTEGYQYARYVTPIRGGWGDSDVQPVVALEPSRQRRPVQLED